MMRSFLFLLSLIISTLSFSATRYNKLSPSLVNRYQVKSQYGPESTILNELFSKDSKLELSLGGDLSALSSLMNHYGVTGSAVYHFNRRHAIEPVWVSYQFGGNLTPFVEQEIRDKNPGTVAANSQLGVDVPTLAFAASYLFTPYYNKMHVTDTSVLHLDMYLGLGLAYIKSEEMLLNGATGQESSRVGGALTAGLRVMFKDRWALRMELKDLIYEARNIGTDEIVNDIMVTAGFSIFFGAFPDYTSL